MFLTTQYLEEADRLAQKVAIINEGKIIRIGTPGELKRCCGGESRITIRLADRMRLQVAREALQPLSESGFRSVPETGEISFPAGGGSSMLAEAVRRMDAAGLALDELALKQPTLDDVFLSITGHTAEESGAKPSDSSQKPQGGQR